MYRFLLMTITIALLAGPAQAVCSIETWNEHFEAPGYDMPWTEQNLRQADNRIYPDASTSLLGNPAGWGNEFFYLNIRDTLGGALTRTELPLPFVTLLSHLEFIVVEENLVPDTWVVMAVAKYAGGPNEPWPVAWAVDLMRRDSLEIRFRAALPNFESFVAVTAGQRYALDIWYSPLDDVYAAYLNGVKFAGGALPALYPEEIWWLVVGSSGSSTGRNVTLAMDNYTHMGMVCP